MNAASPGAAFGAWQRIRTTPGPRCNRAGGTLGAPAETIEKKQRGGVHSPVDSPLQLSYSLI